LWPQQQPAIATGRGTLNAAPFDRLSFAWHQMTRSIQRRAAADAEAIHRQRGHAQDDEEGEIWAEFQAVETGPAHDPRRRAALFRRLTDQTTEAPRMSLKKDRFG
jgi:hypothetical protein